MSDDPWWQRGWVAELLIAALFLGALAYVTYRAFDPPSDRPDAVPQR